MFFKFNVSKSFKQFCDRVEYFSNLFDFSTNLKMVSYLIFCVFIRQSFHKYSMTILRNVFFVDLLNLFSSFWNLNVYSSSSKINPTLLKSLLEIVFIIEHYMSVSSWFSWILKSRHVYFFNLHSSKQSFDIIFRRCIRQTT